jgi:superfamily II DNA helicase RecQ
VLKLYKYPDFVIIALKHLKMCYIDMHFLEINIHSQVRTKASSQEECLQELEELLKTRYSGQSGIIYTTSIKDCEQLMHGLRNRKLRVGCYHANLDAALRSKVHAKWLSGEYQVGPYCCACTSRFCHILYQRCHKHIVSSSATCIMNTL